MKYLSTRGQAPILEFEGVLLAGLASDGGLYVPESWPQLSASEIRAFARKPYSDVAIEVMRPFIGEALSETEFSEIVERAYLSFQSPAVAPLVQLDHQDWLLELFHGPTLAFKDVAMQLLGGLFEHFLTRSGGRMTVIGATSGDTGSAAIEALRGLGAVDVFILHPEGRVSDVQRRQMTTVLEPNIHNIALKGDFDACQACVKALFADAPFREETRLGGVNSINWARIMAQTVYYFTAAAALGAPDRTFAFSTPTGNFGDIFAGYVAKRMGLPIERLIIATNTNDILDRTLRTGRHDLEGVQRTSSPSMDIQVSSNFERLLFEASGRDADEVARLMALLKQSGGFALEGSLREMIGEAFCSERVGEEETLETIAGIERTSGMVIDPHSATGVAAARKARSEYGVSSPIISLATAHPAKFPAAVEKAIHRAAPLPSHLADLFDREERCETLENDVSVVKTFIRDRVRPS